MKYAFVFPGQGSQHIGMGAELYRDFRVAREVFDAVDDALGEHLFDLMQNGAEKELTLTVNAQPAIMAVSMATVRVLQKEFDIDLAQKLSFVAGHSLGEYSAACATGVFSLEDTAKLLRLRGLAMQKAVPEGVGGMAAIIGLSPQDIESLIEAVSTDEAYCVAANDNMDGQVVLSGHLKAIDKALDLAFDFGAKRAIKLPVSAPFHSPLMKDAEPVMAKALSEVLSHQPKIKLISNVTAEPAQNKEEIISNLVKQVTSGVRWRETMAFLEEQNVTDVIEIGPSNVLSNMFKRAYKNIYTTAVHTKEDLEELANNL